MSGVQYHIVHLTSPVLVRNELRKLMLVPQKSVRSDYNSYALSAPRSQSWLGQCGGRQEPLQVLLALCIYPRSQSRSVQSVADNLVGSD